MRALRQRAVHGGAACCLLGLPGHVARVPIVPERDEPGVAQVVIWRLLQILKSPHQHRLEPAALPHLLGGQALAPAACSGLRQIRKGTLGACQFLEPPIQLLSGSRRKPITGSCDIQKPAVLVAPEDQGVKVSGSGRISTDHEFLLPINPHLAPRTGASTRFVNAVQALCYKTLQSVGAHSVNQVRQATVQCWTLADRFADLRKNVTPEQIAACRKVLGHDIPPEKYQDVEYVIDDPYPG